MKRCISGKACYSIFHFDYSRPIQRPQGFVEKEQQRRSMLFRSRHEQYVVVAATFPQAESFPARKPCRNSFERIASARIVVARKRVNMAGV